MVLSFNLKVKKANLLYGTLGRKITYNQIKGSQLRYFDFIYLLISGKSTPFILLVAVLI